MEQTSAYPTGLRYQPDAITLEQHDRLVSIIDQQPWLTELRRRVQHYGYRYDYKGRAVDASQFLGPLPDWLQSPLTEFQRTSLIEQTPDQVIVNEYEPGQGISAHIDCRPCFGETILSLTLGSTCVMEFTRADEKRVLLLAPRSVLIMQGEARHSWKHAIPARKTDHYNGQTFERQRRLSLTFRNVVLP